MMEVIRDHTHKRHQYSEEMLKIAILRAFIIEDWPRNILFWTALHDIKDESCDEIRQKLTTHGHIVTHKLFKAFLWRGKHILTWDESTFTAYDEPQFKLPEPETVYPVNNWNI
jgi:hypothetical protein